MGCVAGGPALNPPRKNADTDGMRCWDAFSRGLSLILAGFAGLSHTGVAADAPDYKLNLPLVFEPSNKKYFIGGNAKFLLKQSEMSSVIDLIEIAVDGGDFKTYEQAIQFKEEGKHTLRFRAKNPVNNWSPVQFTEVFVDLTPPVTEAKWGEKGAFKDESGQYFGLGTGISLVAQDNLSGVGRIEYSWDDNLYVPFLKAIPVEKPGRQTLYFRSVDKVGNIEPVKKIELIGDGTPPVSTMKLMGTGKQITVGGKAYLGVSDSAGFTLEASDESSKVKTIWISLDGAPWTPYLKTIYFLKDGPHTLKYLAEDNVGNREEAKTIQIYTVSQAPRTIATTLGKVVNTGGVNFAARDFQLKLTAQDNAVGLDRIEIKEDAENDFRTYVEPIRFTRPGLHNVSYRSVDRAGNVEPSRVFTVMIHTATPETQIATAAPLVLKDGLAYSPSPNVISLSVANSTVGVETTLISIDEAPLAPYKGPFTLTAERKVHKIAYKSVDKLGNEEATKTVSYHMISTNPVVDLFVSDGKSAEEKVRTNYFDGAPTASPPPQRAPAAVKPGKQVKRKGK